MKLETLQKKVDIIRGEEIGDQSYGIDAKNMHLAIQAFYQYSNPIGSIIREIVSNGYDAHIEANVTDKPVIISFDKSESEVRITDFGVGLSPERVSDIFTKFFSSTKRETNDQIGAFGLGSKSPLSYSDMFQVRTKYGSTVYEYIIHKADGVPSLVKVDDADWKPRESPWQEHENGTSVIIPVEPDDMDTFIREAKNQLAYFDQVYLDGPECDEYNREKIFRATNYIYRGSKGSVARDLQSLHICVGKVFYPLSDLVTQIKSYSYDALFDAMSKAWSNSQNMPGIERVGPFYKMLQDGQDGSSFASTNRQSAIYLQKVPVALYFDIGELPILWHRENIEYTKQAWQKIMVRFYEVLFEMKARQATTIGDITSLRSAILSRERDKSTEDGNIHFHQHATQATHTNVTITDLEKALSDENSYTGHAKPLPFTRALWTSHKDTSNIGGDTMLRKLYENSSTQIYRIEKGESRKPYLTDYMEHAGYKHLVIPVRDFEEIYESIGAKTEKTKALIRKYANEFFEEFDKLPQANDIDIPVTFKGKPKAKTVTDIPILMRNFSPSESIMYNREDLKKIIDGKRLYSSFKTPKLLVYGFQDDRHLLDKYCKYNKSTIFRKPFGRSGDNYYDMRGYLGIISKETAEYIGDIVPSVYIKDFLHHRRALSNLCTVHMLGLYEEKYPWFAEMANSIPKSMWTKLYYNGMISENERNRLKNLSLVGTVYNKTHFMYPYIMEGLKKRYIHFDELEFYKWAHGMYAKWAPILNSEWLSTDLKKRANNYYFAKTCEQVQQNINPILYRKYHVKYIES